MKMNAAHSRKLELCNSLIFVDVNLDMCTQNCVYMVEPLVVDYVLIYFNTIPGFSGRLCRCLKFNKAFGFISGFLVS